MDNLQLYQELSQLNRNIGNLEGKVTGISDQLNEHMHRMNRIDTLIQAEMADIQKEIRHIEVRTRALEKKQFAIYAIAAAVSSATAFITKLSGLFN